MLVGEQGRSLRNSPGERKLLGYWCRLSSGTLGVGEVSRRAERVSAQGWRAALWTGRRRTRIQQRHKNLGKEVWGWVGDWESATEREGDSY